MHACPWRVGDDDVRTTVLSHKRIVQNILHVSCEEEGVVDAVDLRVHFGVLNGFRNVLNADDLPSLLRHEIGNRPRTRIEVINQRFFTIKRSVTIHQFIIIKRHLPCYFV